MALIALAAALLAADPNLGAAAEPAPATTARLTAAGLFDLARRAERSGDSELAARAYEALARDPDSTTRAEARFRHARMLASAGRLPAAAALLRRLLDEHRDATAARLELARLLDRMGDKDSAWQELRSVQAGRLPPEVARLVDRYSEALRSARPLGASFELAIAPDSNINRSTRSDTLGTVLGDFTIDQQSQARSGTGLALRGQAFRRFALGGDGDSLLVRAGGLADLYRRARFNDIALQLSAGPELQLGRNRLQLELGASQRWFGQAPFVRSLRAGAHLARPLGRRSQLRASGSAALVDNQRIDLQDGRSLTLHLGLERALTPAMGVAVHAAADRMAARDPGYSTTGWRAGLTGWRDVGRATVTASAELGRLDADERLALFPHKRSDRLARLTIGASFRQLAIGGFAPVARLTHERNRSTVEFHDYRRTRAEWGVVRAF